MEPLKIEITVKMSDETLKGLDNIATVITAGLIALGGKREDFLDYIKGTDGRCNACQEEPEPAPAPAPAPAPEPEPAPVDDMPAEIADPISDDDLIAEVAETKKTVPAKTIKDLFGKYGIPCSTKCPQEKRAAFVSDLKALRDAQ